MYTYWLLTEKAIDDEGSQDEIFILASKNKPTKKKLLELDFSDHEADLLLTTGDTKIIGDYFYFALTELPCRKWEFV